MGFKLRMPKRPSLPSMPRPQTLSPMMNAMGMLGNNRMSLGGVGGMGNDLPDSAYDPNFQRFDMSKGGGPSLGGGMMGALGGMKGQALPQQSPMQSAIGQRRMRVFSKGGF